MIFFLVLLVGFVAGKAGIIKKEYLPNLAQIITKILLPVLFFHGAIQSVTVEKLVDNTVILIFAAVLYVVLAVVLFALAKIMRLKGDRDRVFTFCFMFGNTGFVGVPLLIALFPDTGLLYMILFTVVDQLVFWTFGVWLATARDCTRKFSIKSFVTPNIIAIVLAFVFIFAEIPLPDVVLDTLGTLSNATSAMCMMYLGAMVCFSRWSHVIKCKELYVGIIVKMIVIPVIGGHLLMLLGLPNDMMVSMVAIMALPVMTVVPIVASMYGHEGEYAAGMTVITLVVSVVSIPLVQLLAFL